MAFVERGTREEKKQKKGESDVTLGEQREKGGNKGFKKK